MHPSWARADRKQLVLPTPLKFTYSEELLRRTVINEYKLKRQLSYDEAEALDEVWEQDKERMRSWIDFQLGSRDGLNKHVQ